MEQITESGKYRARASDWGIGASANGTPSVMIQWEISGPEEHKGKVIYQDIYLTEKSLEIATRSLRRAGWKGEDLRELDNRGGGLDAHEVELDCQIDAYEGESRLKVKWVNQLGGFRTNNKPNADAFAGFAERMRTKIRSVTADAPSKGAAQPPPPSVDESAIPF